MTAILFLRRNRGFNVNKIKVHYAQKVFQMVGTNKYEKESTHEHLNVSQNAHHYFLTTVSTWKTLKYKKY